MSGKGSGLGYQVLKFETYRAMPWRNGRGTTLEIARSPALGEDFAWRLSLADIEEDSEFSPYPGYRRALVLVAGKGLRLRFRRYGGCDLGPQRRGIRFEGDWRTTCSLPEGRCTDLSLIVRRGPAGRPPSLVRAPQVLRLKSATRVVLAKDLHGALFVLEGSIAVSQSIRARPRTVRARDTLLLERGPERPLWLRNVGKSTAQVVLLRWRSSGRD